MPKCFKYLSFFLIFFVYVEAFALNIHIKESAVVKGEEVFLKDIIKKVEGEGKLSDKLLNLEILSSPMPCREKNITGRRVSYIIKQSPLFLKSMKIVFPKYLTIKRSGQKLSYKQIEDFFTNEISKKFKKFKIEELGTSAGKCFPEGELKLKLIRYKQNENSKYVNIYTKILIDDAYYKDILLSGSIVNYEKVVCSLKNIKRNEEINDSNVGFCDVDVDKVRKDHLRDINKIYGLIAKNSMPKDSPLKMSHLKKKILVKKGGIVEVLVKINGLTISTVGNAQSDAVKGEKIFVRNVDTKKLIISKVIGPSKVEAVSF